MAREDSHPTRTECYNIVRLRTCAGNFHAERTDRHARDGETADAFGAARKYPAHIGKGHVTFKRNPIDNRSVA